MYSASASLGPRLVLTDEALPDSTAIELDIARRGASVFQGDSSVGRIKRPFTELIEYLFCDNDFPVGVFLMPGTGVVPDDDFTLHPGDVVTISIDGIGTLRNTVVVGD
jgi:2-dehydro-3-deoxy-D-arabinonate dehydratase